MAWTTRRVFSEGTAVGKMAASLGSSGWWQRWRRRLSARDGSRMLLLLLLLGSGQGPRQVGAGQTFEYLKREHSLSKPYQGEAPGARWARTGRASGPELFGRGGGGAGLRGPEETAGGGWGPTGTPTAFGSHGSEKQGSASPLRPALSARSFQQVEGGPSDVTSARPGRRGARSWTGGMWEGERTANGEE